MDWRLVVGAVIGLTVAYLLTMVDAALARMSHVRAEELAGERRRGATSLLRILDDSASYLAVIHFVRAIGEMSAAVFVTVAVMSVMSNDVAALATAIAILTAVTFAVVSVSPRTLGQHHADDISLAAAPIVVWLRNILGPIAQLLVLVANAVTPGGGYRDGPFRSESELRGLLDMAGEHAVIEDDEREMIHSVFELGDTLAKEVMVPRTDMITIESTKPARKARSLFLRSGFSRIPVIGEDADDIVGLLYFKDVVERITANPAAEDLPVTEMMRPMPFVPDSKPCDDLLREMQRDQTHLAVVIDEYGGTAGLVTIEDILEEIVGEISDEYDREAPGVEDLGGGRYRLPAFLPIDDLADLYDVDIEEDDVETVGGLLSKLTGRVPIAGTHVEVAGLQLTAERMSGRRHRVATLIVEPARASARRHPPVANGDRDSNRQGAA
ncbi:hemolysin family protein [Kribbia dieselivorans]|uniref:hemolysin family protein n=1 Tax=Kribbia dieselivorans TaxID=331526 RepID=UPI0009F827B9|nr:hemolysin family protein [Kribbia dieselivorans]